MSFSWAVTDKTTRNEPKPDTFRGYFTDIQRAARRSLPKNPDKELCKLLGLALVPAGNESERAKHINKQIHDRPTDLKPVTVAAVESGVKETEIKASKETFTERLLSKLPCRGQEKECSEREKMISSFAVYSAIVIFVLLIIVIILAATISALSKKDDEASSISLGGSSSTVTPSTPPSLSTTPANIDTTVSSLTSAVTSKTTTVSARSTTLTSNVTFQPSVSSTQISASTTPKSPTSVTSSSSTVSSSTPLSTDTAEISTSTPKPELSSPSISTTPVSVDPNSGATSTGLPESTTISSVTTSKKSSIPNETSVSSSSNTVTTAATQKSSSAFQTTISGPTELSVTPSSPSTSQSPSGSSRTSTPSTTSSSLTTSQSTSASTSLAPLPLLETPRITCTSPACIAARRTMERVSYDTSPCSDFYEFACGDWINKAANQLADSSQRNVPSTLKAELRFQLIKQLQVLLQAVYYETDSLTKRISRRLYQSCLESNINGDTELALKELREVLTTFRMRSDGEIEAPLDTMMSIARNTFQITPFFKMSTISMEDGNGGKVFGIKISPPNMFLDLDDYRGPFQNNNVGQLYVTRVTEILSVYLSSFNTDAVIPGIPNLGRKKRQNEGLTYEEVYFKVLQSFSIDVNISQLIEKTSNSGSSDESNFNIVTFLDLKDVYPNINWVAALGISSNAALIRVETPGFFQALNSALPNYNEEDVKLFVFLSVLVQRVWPYMPYPLRNMLRDISDNKDAIYSGFDCVEKSIELAHEETHALYVAEYTQQVLKNRLNVASLETTVDQMFKTLLSQTSWVMNDLELVVSVFLANTKLVFSPVRSYIRETEGIVTAQKSFLSLAIELHQQKQGYESFLVTAAVDEDNYIRDWTSTELSYEPTLNIIGVPTGMAVFINNDEQPNFDFHGYMGFMLAQQILKVMTGEMTNGGVPDWWGENNYNLFEPILQCFTSQIPQTQTDDVGNVILANGAFQIIHEVFRTGTAFRQQFIENTVISEEMLFYINIAQLECSIEQSEYQLKKSRVNNIMSNSEQFAEIFSCPKHSPLRTDRPCYFFF